MLLDHGGIRRGFLMDNEIVVLMKEEKEILAGLGALRVYSHTLGVGLMYEFSLCPMPRT